MEHSETMISSTAGPRAHMHSGVSHNETFNTPFRRCAVNCNVYETGISPRIDTVHPLARRP
jgi:hypothetical protein